MKLLTLLIVLSCHTLLYSQSKLPALIGTTGNGIANTSGYLDYSIGEVITSTFENNTSILSQGFLQGNLDNPNGVFKNEMLSQIVIYPNPVSEWITIVGEVKKIKYVSICNNLGEELSTTYFITNRLDVGSLLPGLYSLKIFDNNNQLLFTNKFLKL